jgi:long-chain acyl-CoA synthetase
VILQAPEIEGALVTHPLVSDAAVVGRPDPVLGERPVAFLELERDWCHEPEALRALSFDQLERYRAPAEVQLVDALPRDAAGAVDRPALRRLVAVPR